MSYAARYGAEGEPTGASEGTPLPAHCLTGALIRAKTLSRRHFVQKVRCAHARMPYHEYACIVHTPVGVIGTDE